MVINFEKSNYIISKVVKFLCIKNNWVKCGELLSKKKYRFVTESIKRVDNNDTIKKYSKNQHICNKKKNHIS